MKLGERIRARRKELKISVEELAKQLGVSVSTVYRYEDSSIEKIPVHVFDKLCEALQISASELLGNKVESTMPELPEDFQNAQEAMEFMIKIPSLAAFGGYDPKEMDEETIVEFANEILQQLKLVSYKYRK